MVVTRLLAGCLEAALPAYTFIDFEREAGWELGVLTGKHEGLSVIQGTAAVVEFPEADSRQVLELGPSSPFAAAFIEASSVAKAPVVFCDFFCKPVAVEEGNDAEFFDFGGAVLGFFRKQGRAELRALFGRSDEESVWISTGALFEIDAAGAAAEWLHVTVRLNRVTERWEVRVGGKPLLAGLRAVPREAGGLPLWLYGQEAQASRFDDLLLSAVEPDQLEKMIEWRRSHPARRAAPIDATAPKVVTQNKPPARLRAQVPAIQEAARSLTGPVLRDWSLALESGGTVYRGGAWFDHDGQKTSIVAHGVPTDAEGKALPGTVVMTADVELRPGVDLSKLRWLIAEMKKWPNELGEVMDVGDFSTGLVQTVVLSPEWMRKAASVQVWVAPNGPDVFWWRTRARKHDAGAGSGGPGGLAL